jgi:hypothetical protein
MDGEERANNLADTGPVAMLLYLNDRGTTGNLTTICSCLSAVTLKHVLVCL